MPHTSYASSQQIFLVSRTEEENHLLRRKLEVLGAEFSPIQFVSSHPQGLVASINGNTAAVILNYNDWTPRDGQIIEELRTSGYHGPIVLMAKTQLPDAIKALRSLDQIVFVEKPFETRDLLGIVRKFLSDRSVSQRIHRRYPTMQEAEVEFFATSDKENSRLHNLSKGGAYLELSGATVVKVGDLIRLKLELKELNRTYTMPAKIVWMKKESPDGGTGVGVEFIGPGDVHRSILGS